MRSARRSRCGCRAQATCRAIDTIATHLNMSKTTPSRTDIQRTACATYQEWHSPYLGVGAGGMLDSVCARTAQYERVQRRLSRFAHHTGLRLGCKPGMGSQITSLLLRLCPERTGSTAPADHKQSTTPSHLPSRLNSPLCSHHHPTPPQSTNHQPTTKTSHNNHP